MRTIVAMIVRQKRVVDNGDNPRRNGVTKFSAVFRTKGDYLIRASLFDNLITRYEPVSSYKSPNQACYNC